MIQVLHGDCLLELPKLPDNSIDAIVTDPPYCLESIRKRFGSPTAKPTSARQHRGIARGFMGCSWDDDIAFKSDVWNECLRILKPGGYMVAFGGCRTYHRLVCAIEDAGFVIHPMLAWAFGTGFPKATNASKMIDSKLGAKREIIGKRKRPGGPSGMTAATGWNDGPMADDDATVTMTASATPEAAQWEGWCYGLQSLKPALEPICMAQKPMIGTGAENILAWGVGAVNIDACRVGPPTDTRRSKGLNPSKSSAFPHSDDAWVPHLTHAGQCDAGRWPPNLLHDGSEEVVECFPNSKSCNTPSHARPAGSILGGRRSQGAIYPGEDGSAARFFPALGYSEDERRVFYQSKANKRDRAGSKHPTIKPIKLMEWLCKLICPPNGTILDPFAGSGSTGQAASNLGFDCILIEQSEEYVADIQRRMNQSDDLVTFTRSTTNFSLSSP